ncbi:alcohol dehydrogenase [Trichodelitschia bisporula]|uniref:Alcohol dehydrogenase n=1 Tax=Trichodelitschia bisporula TaxID=703511 RepID=A0A6G1I867_9PEZI|nr:alcohol dehydrogenase [Trichodelitschia bisporula]
MKAGQFDFATKKAVVNDVPIPEPGPNQVLIKVKSASLCHSDLMPDFRPEGPPRTMGHEGVGVITKLHPSVEGRDFKVGDHVGAGYFVDACFKCDGCLTHNMLCQTKTPRLQGFIADGFFAEYAIVEYENLAVLPKEVDLSRYAPVFCAGITAFHAVDSCELKPGEWLAVIGCGGLGQLATQYAKAMGLKVVGIDVNDTTLEVTKAQGADAIFNSRSNPNYVAELKKLTDGGAHAAAVFSDADAAYAHAPEVLRLRGLLMVVGLPKNPLKITAVDLCIGKYRIKGESTSIPQRMKKAVDFTVKHGILPEVEFRKLEELQDMIDEMTEGKATKRMAVVFD